MKTKNSETTEKGSTSCKKSLIKSIIKDFKEIISLYHSKYTKKNDKNT